MADTTEASDDVARALELILDPRPSDYSNIIRRFSQYTGMMEPAPSRGSSPARRPVSRTPSSRRDTSPSPFDSTSVALSRVSSTGTAPSLRTPSRAWSRRTLFKAAELVKGSKATLEEHRSVSMTSQDTFAQDAATSSKIQVLEEENASLRQRVAMLEAVQSVEAEDLDKLGRFRIRMLKAQNMQLELEVLSLAGTASLSASARTQLLEALGDLQQKAAELQEMPSVPQAPYARSIAPSLVAPLSPTHSIRSAAPSHISEAPSHVSAATSSSRRHSLPGRGPGSKLVGGGSSAATPSSNSRGSSTVMTPSLSSSASPSPRKVGTSSFAASGRKPLFGVKEPSASSGRSGAKKAAGAGPSPMKKAASHDPAASTLKTQRQVQHPYSSASKQEEPSPLAPRTQSAMSAKTDDSSGIIPDTISEVSSVLTTDTARLLKEFRGPMVAVNKDWLGDLEKLCVSLEQRLKSLKVPERWLNGVPAPGAWEERLRALGVLRGLAGEAGPGKQDTAFIAGTANRFVARNADGGAVAGVSENMARILRGTMPLVQYSQVHELESRLGDLHPRLLTLCSLLGSLIFPSLPAETSGAILDEIQSALSDVQYAARCVAELAALVPNGAHLRGFDHETSEAEEAKASAKGPTLEVQALDQQRPPRLSTLGVALSEPLGGTGSETAPLAGMPSDGSDATHDFGGLHNMPPSVVSQFPTANEILETLPKSWASAAEEEEARCTLEAVVEKLRNAEARWQAETRALQTEMAFYRGCHAAQAWHVKQVLAAGQSALESMLGDTYLVTEAAVKALHQILDVLENAKDENGLYQLRNAVARDEPVLRQFVSLFPHKLDVSKAVQGQMDPLEKAFKARMQDVFEKLQSRRASLARERAANGWASPRNMSPTKPGPNPGVPSPYMPSQGSALGSSGRFPSPFGSGRFAKSPARTRPEEKKLMKALTLSGPRLTL